ncbi:tail fiber domain-containing protein, partial [Escherichia coli]|nr:tail fiber domain-containing protein [Escherichia coli]
SARSIAIDESKISSAVNTATQKATAATQAAEAAQTAQTATEAARDEAVAQATTATSAADTASIAADTATSAADTATSARDEAVAARDDAEGYSVLAGERAAIATSEAENAAAAAAAAAESEANAQSYVNQLSSLTTITSGTVRAKTKLQSDSNAVFTGKMNVAATATFSQKITSTADIFTSGKVSCSELTQTSDINEKENIMEIQEARKLLQHVNGYTFNFIGDNRACAGVIAQEWQKILPQVVREVTITKEMPGPTSDGTVLTGEKIVLGVNYSGIVGYLVRVCKDQDIAIVTQDARITALENQVSELVALVKQLTGSEE